MKNTRTSKTPKRKRVKIHEATLENDIRYRGPLSCLHFQILGWLCIAVSQLVLLMQLGSRLDPSLETQLGSYIHLFTSISYFSLPFLLIANFARILNDSDGYRNQLIKNAAATAAIAGLFCLFFYRYFIGAFEAVITEPSQALPTVYAFLESTVQHGFVTFNIFVDLLLCTLVMLFLNYKPKRVFRGKSIHLFRLFALFPIGYEIFCMILKIRSARGIAPIPVWMWPLLPVKPVMTFVLFILLALFVKTRELRFRRHGKTHDEFRTFLKTKRNSWNFSVFLAIMMIIIGLIDFAIMIGFSLNEGLSSIIEDYSQRKTVTEQVSEETAGSQETASASGPVLAEDPGTPDENGFSKETTIAILKGADTALAVGFGNSIRLIFLSPLVLLFSYTRTPKNKKIGMIVPAAGIALILILYLEGFHYGMYRLPFPKLDLSELSQQTSLLQSLQ